MIKRELYLKQIRSLFDTDFVKVIIGMRRCGKTSFLKSIIEELEENNVNKENNNISFNIVVSEGCVHFGNRRDIFYGH